MNKPSHGGGGSRKYYGGERYKGRERRPEEKTYSMVEKPTRNCFYCDAPHYSDQCNSVISIEDRKDILRNKRACFNCTSTDHFANSCKSKGCYNCGRRHQTSICIKTKATPGDVDQSRKDEDSTFEGATADKAFSSNTHRVIHPSAPVKIVDLEARITIDTGSSCNYIGHDMITRLNLKPKKREKRMIEHMFGTVAKMMDIYEVEIKSELTDFKMTIECIGVERDLITELLNPNIPELKRRQPQLVGLKFAEEHSSEEYLPVHILLGVQDYQRIR